MPELRDEEFAPASIVLSSQTEETIGELSRKAPKPDEGLLAPINAVSIHSDQSEYKSERCHSLEHLWVSGITLKCLKQEMLPKAQILPC